MGKPFKYRQTSKRKKTEDPGESKSDKLVKIISVANLSNFKESNESNHKRITKMKPHSRDRSQLKNRKQRDAKSLNYDQADHILMAKYIYSDHSNELNPGESSNKDKPQSSVINVGDIKTSKDSSEKHAYDKMDIMNFNYNDMEWNDKYESEYQDLKAKTTLYVPEQGIKFTPRAERFVYNIRNRLTTAGKYINNKIYSPDRQLSEKGITDYYTTKHNYKTEKIDSLEYVYFDKSGSEDDDNDRDKRKQSHKEEGGGEFTTNLEFSLNQQLIGKETTGFQRTEHKHETEKIDSLEYVYFEKSGSEDEDGIRGIRKQTKKVESDREYTNKLEYSPYRQMMIKETTSSYRTEHKHATEKLDSLENVYFDKSGSEDEHEDKNKQKKTNKVVSGSDYTNNLGSSLDSQTVVKETSNYNKLENKHATEKMDSLEYVYFDKSGSEEEGDDRGKQKQTDNVESGKEYTKNFEHSSDRQTVLKETTDNYRTEHKHATEKMDFLEYVYFDKSGSEEEGSSKNKWKESEKGESGRDFTKIPEYSSNRQLIMKKTTDNYRTEHKHATEKMDVLEYVYFDKSGSEEEGDGRSKQKQTDKVEINTEYTKNLEYSSNLQVAVKETTDNYRTEHKHATEKMDSLEYVYFDKSGSEEEGDDKSKQQHSGKVESGKEYTKNLEYSSDQKIVIKETTYYYTTEHKHKTEKMDSLEYVYLDKSASEDDDDERGKRKQTDKVDYGQVPEYHMENTYTIVDERKVTTPIDQEVSSRMINKLITTQMTKSTQTQTVVMTEKSTEAFLTSNENKTTDLIPTEAEIDVTSSWDHNVVTEFRFNFTYSPVKLMADENPYVPKPPALAKAFHSGTPRLDLFFQPVDNKFSLSSEYLYSIISLSVVTCLILFLTSLIVRFAYCNENVTQKSVEKYQFQIIIFTLLGVCIVSSVVAITALSSVSTMFSELDDSVIQPIISYADEISGKLHKLRGNLYPIDSYINRLRNVFGFLSKFKINVSYMESVLSQVADGKKMVLAITRSIQDKIRAMKRRLSNAMQSPETKIVNLAIVFWVFFILVAITLVVVEQFKEQMEEDETLLKIRKILYIYVALTFMGICWLLVAVTGPVLLAASDFCCDPVESVVRISPVKHALISDDTIRNFMTCNHKHAAIDLNKHEKFVKVKELVKSASGLFDEYGIPETYADGLHKINQALDTASNLAEDLKSCGVSKDAFKSLNEILCSRGINAFFIHVLAGIFAAISILALLVSFCLFEYD